MKKSSKKLVLFFTLSLLLIVSCSKDDKSNPSENSLTTAIITPTGGSIETNEGIKISFPSNSVSVDTEVAIGYTGAEPTTFPNPNVQILGKAFTVKIDANSLNQSAVLEVPKPIGYTTIDETVVLISKEGTNTYYPLYFSESGNKLIAQLDDINYQEIYPALRSTADEDNYITTLIVTFISNQQTPPAVEMGLKKVDANADNTLTFNAVPVLNSSDKVLIMVHGWTGAPTSSWAFFLNKLKPQIQCAGYTQYMTFGYNASLSIDENSIILANLLQTKMNGAKVDIIGHSMGGLVTRSAIEDHGCAAIVRNLITLGTPHLGSSAANLRTFLGKSLFSNYPSSNYSINTQGFRDLIPSSVFLTNLNDNAAPTTNYYPIAALISNILEFDGVVTKASALGIQNNTNLTLGKAYVIPGYIPHKAMTDDENTIIFRVAEKLNLYNNAPSTCNEECEDASSSYSTVTIGSQVWMRKNLNVCKYRNGDDIQQVQDPTQWANLTTGAWCYYENDTANGPIYGKLYNWYAINDPRGLAPMGYHIPTDAEWTTLTNFFGGETVAGGKMKGINVWASPNTGASDSNGFTALPGGYRTYDLGIFGDVGNYGSWWSSSEFSSTSSWIRVIFYNYAYCGRVYDGKSQGNSVRCIKD